MEKNIIYQMALRSFTPDGTINAAKVLLPYVASLGIDIVYICPVFRADDDPDESTWSPRQRASGTKNPKNSYKIIDYYNVDKEYGTNEDLKEFVKEAHNLGLKVLFDLVYLHCGKNAVFIKDNPDFVIRDENGDTLIGATWPFARLNYENRELRRYLIDNMKMFVKDYCVDGFRCDVGDDVPLDFWKEAFEELATIKPDLIKLNEGVKPSHVLTNTFDLNYSFKFQEVIVDLFKNGAPASVLKDFYDSEKEAYGEDFDLNRITRHIDNHDTATDSGIDRNQKTFTNAGVEASLVIIYTYDGTPFLWNGCEFCDDAENSMFSNRFYGKRSAINWSKSYTEEGKNRLEFIRKIHKIWHENAELTCGKMSWIANNCPDKLLSYYKILDDKKAVVIINTKNEECSADINVSIDKNNIYISSGIEFTNNNIKIAPFGYLIAKAD